MTDLEKRVAQLEQMVLQIAKGNVNTIGKVDDTSSKTSATALGLEDTQEDVEVNTADIDYIAMMTDVELPEKEEDASASPSEVEEELIKED